MKFGERQKEGIAIGYGPQGSVVILDQEEYLKNGTAVIVTTPDVQLHPSEFPFRTAGWAEPNLDKLSSAFTRHYHRRLQVQGQKYDKQVVRFASCVRSSSLMRR